MSKRLNLWVSTIALLLLFGAVAQAQIYKTVDKDGNVTYTDQAPADGSPPMVLPELSIIETDLPPASEREAAAGKNESESAPQMTRRDQRRLYADFSITRPVADEAYWGTENQVVISWGSATPLESEMSVRVYIDGVPQANAKDNMAAVTLDRGEHSVYAELLDGLGRTIVTTASVTFHVKQNSIGLNLFINSTDISV